MLRERGPGQTLGQAIYLEVECLYAFTHAVPSTVMPSPSRPLAEILLPFMALQMPSPPGSPPALPPHGDELSPHYADVGLSLCHYLTALKPWVWAMSEQQQEPSSQPRRGPGESSLSLGPDTLPCCRPLTLLLARYR